MTQAEKARMNLSAARWKKEEEVILTKFIQDGKKRFLSVYECAEQAARLLHRSARACEQHWYYMQVKEARKAKSELAKKAKEALNKVSIDNIEKEIPATSRVVEKSVKKVNGKIITITVEIE